MTHNSTTATGTVPQPPAAALEHAYRLTRYQVRLPGLPPRTLRVGQRGDHWLARLGVATLAIITAENPGSRRLAPARNARRDRAFARRLDRLGWSRLRSRAIDPRGAWPVEHGWAIPGMDRHRARTLAADLGQVALVWVESGQRVRLFYTGVSPSRRGSQSPSGALSR